VRGDKSLWKEKRKGRQRKKREGAQVVWGWPDPRRPTGGEKSKGGRWQRKKRKIQYLSGGKMLPPNKKGKEKGGFAKTKRDIQNGQKRDSGRGKKHQTDDSTRERLA